MVFTIAMIHAGLVSAIFAFLLWSLPGAIGMYGLSLGVQRMPDQLPPIVYALLSGMNASTVGIIALAAVQVSQTPTTESLFAQAYIVEACAESDPRPLDQNPGYLGSMCWHLLQCSLVFPCLDRRGWSSYCTLGRLACTTSGQAQG